MREKDEGVLKVKECINLMAHNVTFEEIDALITTYLDSLFNLDNENLEIEYIKEQENKYYILLEKEIDNNYIIKINESVLEAEISDYYFLDDVYEASNIKNNMIYKIVYQIEKAYAKYLKFENSQSALDLLDKIEIVNKVDKLFEDMVKENSELLYLNRINSQINIAKKEILNSELELEYSRLAQNFSILDEDKKLKDKIQTAKNVYMSVINEEIYDMDLLNALNSVLIDKKYNEQNGKDKYIESSEYKDILSQISLASHYMQSKDPNDMLGEISEKIDGIYDTYTKQKDEIYSLDSVEAVRYYIKNNNPDIYAYLGNKVYEENLVELLEEEKSGIEELLVKNELDYDSFYSNIKKEFMKINEQRDEKQQEYVTSLMETYNNLSFKEKENFFRFSFENEEIALDVLEELEDRKNKLKEIQLSFDAFSNVLFVDIDSFNTFKEKLEKQTDNANEIIKKEFEQMLSSNSFLSPLIDNCIEGDNPLKNLNLLSSDARKQLMMTSNYNEKVKEIQTALLEELKPDINKCGASLIEIVKYGSQKEIENAIETINKNKDILELTFYYINQIKEKRFRKINEIEPYIDNREAFYDFLRLYDLLSIIEMYEVKDTFNVSLVDMQRTDNIWLNNLVSILDKEEIRKAELNNNQKNINNKQIFEANKNIYNLKTNIYKGEEKIKEKIES